MKVTRQREKRETVPAQKIRQWGYSAFARYCARIGIPFDDTYYMVFGKYPSR